MTNSSRFYACALLALLARSMSPCGFPPPGPVTQLMNNTRLDFTAASPPAIAAATAEECLAWCVAEPTCGGVTFRTAYEPLPVFGCNSQSGSPCCFPAPLLDDYQVIGPGGHATFGFVAAVVRYGPPAPPWGVPANWEPSYDMNRSISLYWRNATGLEPADYFDGYGLTIFDWAHGAQSWINGAPPMDNAAGLAEQCALIKARSPSTRCVVYRNTAIALNQHRHISAALDDPAYAGYFLKFKPGATQTGACWGETDPRQAGSPWDPIWPTPAVCATPLPTDVHVPMCDRAQPTKCNRVHYFDQNQCPQVPGLNWSNDTTDVYQGLVCNGATCECGDRCVFEGRARCLPILPRRVACATRALPVLFAPSQPVRRIPLRLFQLVHGRVVAFRAHERLDGHGPRCRGWVDFG